METTDMRANLKLLKDQRSRKPNIRHLYSSVNHYSIVCVPWLHRQSCCIEWIICYTLGYLITTVTSACIRQRNGQP